MAAIDFPNSPVNGTTYAVGNVTYTYNASKGVWNITSNGIQGAQGTQGGQGISGQFVGQGAQGTQGVQGRQGTQGTQGGQGLNGLYAGQGAQGTQGVQGTQGFLGTQGRDGQFVGQGAQGTQGVQGLGSQGAQGTQGASWGIRVSTAESTAVLSWDSSLYDMYVLTGQYVNLTINADSAATPMHGQRNLFRIKTAGTSVYTITFATGTSKSFRSIGTTLPGLLTPGNVLYIGCVYNATEARWDVIGVREGSA